MKSASFIGLGTMGFHMAGHLAKSKSLTVFNRTTAKADKWKELHKGSVAQSIHQASSSDVILICAGRDSDVREIVAGPKGILSKASPGTMIIDHTTTSAQLAEQLSDECRKHECTFIDAPVSGGEQGAVNGQLSIMVGCEESEFEQVKAITAPYTKSIAHMGKVGNGQKTKMVNQICIAGLLQGLAEGLNFASRAGLDIDSALTVVSKGAAGSWQMENRSQTMLENHYDHGFALDWMVKDLNICLDEANRNGASLPVTALVTQFYKELQNMGCGREDTSALLKRLQKMSN